MPLAMKNGVHLALHFLIFRPIKMTYKPAQAPANAHQVVNMLSTVRRSSQDTAASLPRPFYLLVAMRPANDLTRAFPVPTSKEVAL